MRSGISGQPGLTHGETCANPPARSATFAVLRGAGEIRKRNINIDMRAFSLDSAVASAVVPRVLSTLTLHSGVWEHVGGSLAVSPQRTPRSVTRCSARASRGRGHGSALTLWPVAPLPPLALGRSASSARSPEPYSREPTRAQDEREPRSRPAWAPGAGAGPRPVCRYALSPLRLSVAPRPRPQQARGRTCYHRCIGDVQCMQIIRNSI